MAFMKYLILTISFILVFGDSISTAANKPSPKKNSKQVEIEGVWSSDDVLKYHGIRNVTIRKVKKNKFRASLFLEDGRHFVEFLTLDEKGEYHTYNRYREYYKMTNGALVAYDKEGFLFYLWKKES
jgi:hypothetical protein